MEVKRNGGEDEMGHEEYDEKKTADMGLSKDFIGIFSLKPFCMR